MDKKAVSAFFDSLADSWDDDMIKIQWKIDKILDVAEVTEGKTVLDVACGTGVLIPDYLKRNVEKCVAVDISERMIEIAKIKFSQNDNIPELLELVDEGRIAMRPAVEISYLPEESQMQLYETIDYIFAP
jgi:ubiquinone/menaquinone biosynthesis C-methylase UbiE